MEKKSKKTKLFYCMLYWSTTESVSPCRRPLDWRLSRSALARIPRARTRSHCVCVCVCVCVCIYIYRERERVYTERERERYRYRYREREREKRNRERERERENLASQFDQRGQQRYNSATEHATAATDLQQSCNSSERLKATRECSGAIIVREQRVCRLCATELQQNCKQSMQQLQQNCNRAERVESLQAIAVICLRVDFRCNRGATAATEVQQLQQNCDRESRESAGYLSL